MKLTIQENGYSDGKSFFPDYHICPLDAEDIIQKAKLTGFDWVSVYLPEFGLDFTARPSEARKRLIKCGD